MSKILLSVVTHEDQTLQEVTISSREDVQVLQILVEFTIPLLVSVPEPAILAVYEMYSSAYYLVLEIHSESKTYLSVPMPVA